MSVLSWLLQTQRSLQWNSWRAVKLLPMHWVFLFFFCFSSLTCTDSFHEQLIEDSAFLKAEGRLDTELVDKLILQLNRIYPQILSDKEATRVSPELSHSLCLWWKRGSIYCRALFQFSFQSGIALHCFSSCAMLCMSHTIGGYVSDKIWETQNSTKNIQHNV